MIKNQFQQGKRLSLVEKTNLLIQKQKMDYNNKKLQLKQKIQQKHQQRGIFKQNEKFEETLRNYQQDNINDKKKQDIAESITKKQFINKEFYIKKPQNIIENQEQRDKTQTKLKLTIKKQKYSTIKSGLSKYFSANKILQSSQQLQKDSQNNINQLIDQKKEENNQQIINKKDKINQISIKNCQIQHQNIKNKENRIPRSQSCIKFNHSNLSSYSNFPLKEKNENNQQLYKPQFYMKNSITPTKINKFQQILKKETRYFDNKILENLYQPQLQKNFDISMKNQTKEILQNRNINEINFLVHQEYNENNVQEPKNDKFLETNYDRESSNQQIYKTLNFTKSILQTDSQNQQLLEKQNCQQQNIRPILIHKNQNEEIITFHKGGSCEQNINSDQCILQKIQDNLIAEPIKQLQDQQEEEESQQIDLKIEEETFDEKIDKNEYQNKNIQILDQQRNENPIQKEDNMYQKIKLEEMNKQNPNNSQNQVIDKNEQNVIYTMDFQKSIQKEQQLITGELQSTQISNSIDYLQNNLQSVNSFEQINQNISHQNHLEKQVYQKSIHIKEEENPNTPQQIVQEQDIINKKSQDIIKPNLQDKPIKPFINLEDPNSIETIYVQGSIYDYVEVKNRKGQVSYMPKRISARQNRRKNQNKI